MPEEGLEPPTHDYDADELPEDRSRGPGGLPAGTTALTWLEALRLRGGSGTLLRRR
jgi:hypothetical protein